MELYQYKGTIKKIVDGDTMDVMLDLGFNTFRLERLRLARINCPEMGTPEGQTAKDTVKVFEGLDVLISTKKTDKYGRYIAEVNITVDNVKFNISDMLVTKGFAQYVVYK